MLILTDFPPVGNGDETLSPPHAFLSLPTLKLRAGETALWLKCLQLMHGDQSLDLQNSTQNARQAW